MRIEAEKTIAGQAERCRGNVVFIIKGLYDEPVALEATPSATAAQPAFQIKGMDDPDTEYEQ
jgi:hypothetical protein